MVEISDSLRAVFSAPVHERDGAYIVEIPSREVAHDALTVGETYRVALLNTPTSTATTGQDTPQSAQSQRERHREPPEPPVDEGEVREVTIETIGDQGDGIAKVERGYVVIVSGAQPGEQPTVEIDQVQENVAFASVVEDDPRAL
ncbi:TRAM domain-containing protein [Halalkalicoccus sp. NIPERK01]|uniref:TRAM domain-containing protein n=1 Tax=Halalkalicoccus sp. NIPERK01 TaxID=3053469 RepID=UPI00256F4F6C|nr:TRAM domain-containing protein [Halalkalicoccus sp. NIPERK01]MDL5363856.1 TRAM domain-containing protein [Halalkalicoccus sp. NIPERK01]